MKYALAAIAALVTMSGLAPAQPPAPRDVRVGPGRITELTPAAGTPAAVQNGYWDYAAAVRSLNPSYAIAPVIGNSAVSGGSFYIRAVAVPAYSSTIPPYTSYYTPGDAYLRTAGIALPPPVVLGGSWWNVYPNWLYSGTVQVDAPARVATAEDLSAAALRDEVRKLRLQVEELNKRIAREK